MSLMPDGSDHERPPRGRSLNICVVRLSHAGVGSDVTRALRGMGHVVTTLDLERQTLVTRLVHRNVKARRVVRAAMGALYGDTGIPLRRHLMQRMEVASPDLVLVLPLRALAAPAIGRIRQLTGARIAGWFQDAVVNFGRHEFLLADYDALFFKDRYIVERLREHAGLDHIHYLPEGVDPETHRPAELTAEDHRRFACDVAVYGNLYPYRICLLRGLDDLGIDLRIYGNRPPLWIDDPLFQCWQGHGVFGETKAKAVLAAGLVLNNVHFGEVRSVNAKLFEISAIGGFQVTDAPAVEEFFAPGKEIAVFRGPREMADVIRHYLARPEEREAMARRARRRLLREHTLTHRLTDMLQVLSLDS